jgi:hypothetical protein
MTSYDLLRHEQKRWDEMNELQLSRRLQKITRPEKLACFLYFAEARGNQMMLLRGVERCNELGLIAINVRPGDWVVEMSPGRRVTPEQINEDMDLLKDVEGFKGFEEKPKEDKPKKKKSLYSRKLRVRKRR